MEFMELTKQEFEPFANTCEYRHIWQSTTMCKLREHNHWQVYYVGVKENNKLIAASALLAYPVFRGYCLFQSLRGYLLDYLDTKTLSFFHNHTVSFMKDHKGIYFSMDPYVCLNQRDVHGNIIDGSFDHRSIVIELEKLGMKHEGFGIGVDEEHGEPRWMFVLPFQNKNENELLKDMSQLTRRCIKKTQRPGFYLEELKREQLDEYQQLITHTSKRRGFTDRPLTYYENMFDIFHDNEMIKFWLLTLHIDEYRDNLQIEIKKEEKKREQMLQTIEKNPENVKSKNKLNAQNDVLKSLQQRIDEANELAIKYGDRIVLSGAMFLLYGDEVIYLTGGSYDEFMHFCGQYRLQWEMISYALKHGFKRYNFYGISGDFSEKDGVLEFKQGFHGEVQELIGDFHQVLNPMMYKAYKAMKNIKGKIS